MKSKRFVLAIWALDTAVYAVCLLGLWQVNEKAGLPFTVLTPKNGTFEVAGTPRSDTPLVEPGDRIVTFEGKDLNSLEDLEFLLDGMRVDDALTFRIENSAGGTDVSVRLVHAYSSAYVVVAWFVGTLFFLSGVIVFSRRKDDVAAQVYHFGAVAVACVIMATWGCYAVQPVGIGQFVRAVFSTAYAFVPALFVHFSLVFPSRRRSAVSGSEYLLYVIAAFLSVIMAFMFVRSTLPPSIRWFHSFLAVFNVTRWFYVACVVLSVALFVRSYRSATEEMERRKLRWIMLGLAISSLGFVSLWQIPQLLTSRGLVREEIVVLLSAVTPVAFTVAIVKYHVLNIDYLFNRSTVYVMMLVILLSVYALIVGAAAAFVGSFTVTKSIAASAAAAVAVAVLFEPVRRRVQLFVDKNFFRVRYDMREIEKEFTEEIKKCFVVNEVAELAVRTVTAAIPVERIGYFSFDENGPRLRLLAHRGFELLESRSLRFDIEHLKSDLSLPVALEGRVEPGANYEKGDTGVFRRWGVSVVFGAKSEEGGILSLLALGPKKSGTRYSVEDIDLLNFISINSGLAHERILLQKRLTFEHEERERLEEISRMKTYFVSSVSHDLKTPLTTIRMYTEALKEGRKFPASRFQNYLDTIHGESRRLTRLIDNVLDVAKAERGNITFRMEPEELDGIVKETVELMNYEILKGKCRLTTKLNLKHRQILADRDAVIEALGNMVSNSVEYSLRKKNLTVRTFSKGEYSCVSVKDSGIGIPKDDLPRVFEPFFRAKNSTSVRPGGTGLGLSVVKNVMDAHHGHIEIESEPGYGTKITLLFPSMEKK